MAPRRNALDAGRRYRHPLQRDDPDFGLLNPLAHISGADSAMLQAGAELKKHLQ